MIKQITFLVLTTIITITAIAQFTGPVNNNPVTWSFTAKKVADKTYEIHMLATISSGYHLYAQDNHADGPVPTTFTFVKNPLLSFEGKTKEVGSLISKLEPVWGFKVNYFENKVDFVQLIKSKVAVTSTVKGTLNFMVCNDKKCLPPKDVNFEIKIGGK
ncbi:MAG: sugar transporter [Sphingobacteriales bacterium]|nr:sugar transporter [Sphingobacteriales bacterium]